MSLTGEQQDLRDAVRGLLARGERSPWPRLCREVGVAGLAIPECYGGAGAGAAETGVVMEELGRDLTRSPMLGSAVKVYCSDALTRTAGEMIQLHGAIGITWEHPAHRYLKRAHGARLLFGRPDRHAAAIAASLLDRRACSISSSPGRGPAPRRRPAAPGPGRRRPGPRPGPPPPAPTRGRR